MEIDLDAARAARREGRGEHIDAKLDGQSFRFPVEFPVDAAELALKAVDEGWTDDRYIPTLLETLLGTEDWQRFRGLRPAVADVNALYDGLMAAYGMRSGESSSSPDSSAPGGESSKPKPAGSTRKTREPSVRAVS